ncbi:MAG: hypothetical protein WCH05_09010 [Chlorobiaceae bacterium]
MSRSFCKASAMLLLLSMFASGFALAAGRQVGVVLLHGKWGDPSRHIGNPARSMRSRGSLVVTPLMLWSRVS